MFTCKELHISTDKKVLVDINFSFKSSFALIGESGSGKSLSLKAFYGTLAACEDKRSVFSRDR